MRNDIIIAIENYDNYPTRTDVRDAPSQDCAERAISCWDRGFTGAALRWAGVNADYLKINLHVGQVFLCGRYAKDGYGELFSETSPLATSPVGAALADHILRVQGKRVAS